MAGAAPASAQTGALLGSWRRDPLGPPAAVAATTAAVLVGDLLTGTTLQFDSLMGYTAVVGGATTGWPRCSWRASGSRC
ncbi:hypothetical protein GCM10022419_085610 [Nonomuraea rosea]|uniref:Uncharacterized protein n=1 Tax=Nonomuraea rosea TaxID=638574 RepID=A0ABP6YS70_9ACTN